MLPSPAPVPAAAADMPLAVHIVAGFLAAVVLLFLLYIRERIRRGAEWQSLRPLPFLAFAAIFALVLASFIYLLGMNQLQLTDAAVSTAGGVALGLLSPVMAVAFFVANIMLRPWEFVPENLLFMALPKLLAGVCIMSWLWHGFRHQRLSFAWNTPCTLFAAFVGWLCLSTLLTGTLDTGGPYLAERFVPIVVLSFLIMNSVRDELDLKLLKNTILVSVMGIAAAAAYVTLTRPGPARLMSKGLLGNPNDIASLVVIAVPLAISALFGRKKGVLSWGAGCLLVAALCACLWLSQSRGAKLALLTCALGYGLLCMRVTLKRVLLCILLAGVLFPVFIMSSRQEADLVVSSTARYNYLIAGLRMAKSNPFFGVGVGNYPTMYEKYTPSFEEWGERTAHSSWVLALSETGPVGLFLFGSLFLTVLLRGWRLRKTHPELFLSILGYGVAMSFLSHTYLFIPYLLFAMVLAAYRIQNTGGNEDEYADT